MEDVQALPPDATAVRVAVRVRPLIARELAQGSSPCIAADGPCVTVGRDRRFTFDHAFGPHTKQGQVYQELVSPLVESCFDGFNVTVLAYGQTGSGKTFTMGTGEYKHEDEMGIAPRVIRHVFEGIEARKHRAAFYVRAQFLEIYNEDVKDLLMPPAEQAVKWVSREQSQAGAAAATAAGGPGITLRDAGDGTIMVIGAIEEPAECAGNLMELLERGMAARATSSTCANEQSSRSHAILTITIEQHVLASASVDGSAGGAAGGTSEGGASAAGEVRTAKLHLVDLAGSERTKQLLRSSMQGPRFRETVNINQGLLALGNVISALGDERRRGTHVPYRESKLTRLLQDSLGGNSRTAMIACVSPADEVLEETLNTLKYANRAKNIRNKPVINRVQPAPSLSSLGSAVLQVQFQVLQLLAAQLPGGPWAHGLPLAELMALEAADSSVCLDVMTRMKGALESGGSRAGSVGGGLGDVDADAMMTGYSLTIGALLRGLAEMEAQGHVDRVAREHILRALDASMLKRQTVTLSGGLVGSASDVAPATVGSRREGGRQGLEGEAGAVSRERESKLEDRIRSLEAELSSCQSSLNEARDDLQRDEIIFADKLQELEDAHVASTESKQRLVEAEERHAEEVADLRKQLADLSAHVAQQQAARPTGPARTGSRTRVRRQSGSDQPGGPGSLRRLLSTEAPSGSRGGSAPGDGGESGSERGAEEDEVLYDEELLSYISETDYTEQHRREVLESDASLREELAEVLRDKAAAEADRAALERAALAQRSSFDTARAALEQQLSQLSSNITQQQQELQAAQASEKAARELAAQWQERARELESAIDAREHALASLRTELEAVEGNAARSVEERAALRQEYEQRIAAVVAQVTSLQRQLQQHASNGGAERRERQLTADRMAATEAELNRLRAQQSDLRKQLSERMARYERESAARMKELVALRKAAAVARSRMQALEQENRAQRALLREKQLAVMAAEQRLREKQRGTTGGVAGNRSRSSSPGSRRYVGVTGGSGGLSSSLCSNCTSGDHGPTLASVGGGGATGRLLPQSGPMMRGSLPGTVGRSVGPGSGPNRRAFSPGRPTPQAPMAWRARGPTARSSLTQLQDEEPAGGTSRASAGQAQVNAYGQVQPLQAQPAGADAKASAGPQQAAGSSSRASGAGAQQASQATGGAATAVEALEVERQEKVAEWAGELLGVVSEVASVEARLEVLASRQREVLNRREVVLREKAQLSLRTQRRADQLAQELAACDAQLAELMGRIPSPRYDTPPSSAPCTPRDADAQHGAPVVAAVAAGAGGGVGGARRSGGFGGSGGLLSDDWVALQQRIADVSHAKAILESRLRSGRFLDEREQQIVDSLEDQLEDLETQRGVIAGEVADRRLALAQLHSRRDQLQQRTAGMGPEGLRVVLGAATDAVGQRAYQVRRLEAALAASEAGAARQAAQLQMRLRESLVSLSAHLATLETGSPGSSACINSAELRDLLGMFLDIDTAAHKGSSGHGHEQRQSVDQQDRLASPPAVPSQATQAAVAREMVEDAVTQRAGPAAGSKVQPPKAGPHAASAPDQLQDQRDQDHPGGADGGPPYRHQGKERSIGAPVNTPAVARALIFRPLGPHQQPDMSDFTGSLATWGSSQQDAAQSRPGSNEATEPVFFSSFPSKDSVDLSLRDLPHGSPRRAAVGRHTASGGSSSSSAGGGPLDGGKEARGITDLVAADEGGTTISVLLRGSELWSGELPIPVGHTRDGGLALPLSAPSASATMQPSQKQQGQQTGHRRTGSGGVGTSGSGGGILRRAGSSDSMGGNSTASSLALGSGSAAKRVTWGAPHMAAGLGSEAAGAGPGGCFAPGSLPAPGPAGGGPARARERSILDRAENGLLTHALRIPASSSDGRDFGGGGTEDNDGSVLGQAQNRGRTDDKSAAPGHWWGGNGADEGSLRGSLAGGLGDTRAEGGGRRDYGWSRSLFGTAGVDPEPDGLLRLRSAVDMPRQTSSSVDSGSLDDTAADADARRQPSDSPRSLHECIDVPVPSAGSTGRGAGPASGGASAGKPGPRSFNPWRSASSTNGVAKPPRRGAAWEHPQQQQDGPEEQRQGLGSGHVNRRCVSDPGEDDLLIPQDSDSQLRSDGEESAASLGLREHHLVALPGGSGSAPSIWLEARPAGSPAAVPQPARQPTGLAKGPAELRRAEDGVRYGGVLSDGGLGSLVPGAEEGEDAELDEHVRLLAQAAKAARQAPPPADEPPGHDAHGPGSRSLAITSAAATSSSGSGIEGSLLDDEIRSEEALPLAVVVAASSPPPPARRRVLGPPGARSGPAWGPGAEPLPAPLELPAAALSAPVPMQQRGPAPPLRCPARSISPVQHYGRVLRGEKPEARPGPGPFTTPPPAIVATQLADALMPYKAHLKRSTAGASGALASRAAAGTRGMQPPGGRPATAGRQQRLEPAQQLHQHPGKEVTTSNDELTEAATAADKLQIVPQRLPQQHEHLQHRTRATSSSSTLPASAGISINRLDKDERRPLGVPASRQRGYFH